MKKFPPAESEKISDDEKPVEAEKPPQELIKLDNAASSNAYKTIFAMKRGPGISTTQTVENGNFIIGSRNTTAKRSLGYYKLGNYGRFKKHSRTRRKSFG